MSDGTGDDRSGPGPRGAEPGSLDLDRLAALEEETGDRDLVADVVRTFVDEAPARLDLIASAVRSGDAEAVASTAHALGSPAAMLGAVEVRALTRALQQAAAEGRAQDYARLQGEIERATATVVALMRRYVDAATGG